MSLLAAQSLTVTARIGGAAIPVIRNLDFALAPGKILGLVGESGAGKSMVGRAIAQLLPPGFAVTGGRLAFAGEDLATMPAERRRALSGAAFRRAASAGQHRPRALHRAQGADRRRDRLPPRRVGAGAADQFAAAAARRARFLDAVHLPRPHGGAPSVRARARHAARQDRRSGPDRR